MEQALSDVKVLDLSWYIAGPYCTKLLADYGADVIKIERPEGGDPARTMGPFVKDDPHPEKSGLFLHLNTNKRGVTLNLKSATGKEILRKLLADKDILVESFRPGVMERLGFGYEEVRRINPRIVMTSISNFGQTGPYRDYETSDAINYAMGGAMFETGIPTKPPVALVRNVTLHESGWLAVAGTLGAWYGATRSGQGDYVDISLMETMLAGTDRRDTYLVSYAYTGFNSPRQDITISRRHIMPVGYYPTRDGWVNATIQEMDFPKFARCIGHPELTSDPRFQNFYDIAYGPDMDGYFIEWLMGHTKQEASEIMQQAGMVVTPVNSPADVVAIPHFKERGFWVEIDHPVAGRHTFPGAPMDMGEGGFAIRRPAPLLGQHNEEIYSGLGYSREDLTKLREGGVI